MKIAVLMSTYNGGQYVDEQISSIARQTVVDSITIFVRDDGSNDNTFDILEKWKSQVDIVVYKGRNAGPAQSFWQLLNNRDIDADYYFFCDQDDIWDADKVEKQVQVLDEAYCLSICNCRLVDGQGQLIKKARRDSAPTLDIPHLFVSGVSQGCSMAFTNELREFIMRQKLSCIPMHDIIVIMYALIMGKVCWIQSPLFSYRVHSNNVVAKNNKSLLQQTKTIYWNWKNSSKHSLAVVASEMLKSGEDFSMEDLEFLKSVSCYRSSFVNKMKILMNKRIKDANSASLRSYRIRVLLNML